MKKPTTILFFQNLNVAVCDSEGQQIPELQVSFPTLFAEHCQRHGYDVEGCIIETTSGNWRMFKTQDGGWNREVA